ncbi:NADH-cytochrome b5 reductase [Lobosporangium transversale]|uniref:cytochrome-b5 reductase n=1 Tax=Lobosporangium transversale TaxID=64571 RepID=A0A1Y2GBF7_9FUNG|nr:hypothetical protein BCR41DRAFT_390354 [Lobosporangium transversale]KAF9897523.1 NADH-cytochrome b5 reductase [Lobosporangium transversale]ORY99781.1 hypothetical protein BCR41DRAFT_390354 [Lobosporangium transversale]|eukprot:XP_021876015.1 hypothetical protein BCR41DRAFT_390354 [Lobosporangium transversale]
MFSSKLITKCNFSPVTTTFTRPRQSTFPSRFYSQLSSSSPSPPSPPQKTTFNRPPPGHTSARAPRSSTTSNLITFLAASSIGAAAYFYQWNKYRDESGVLSGSGSGSGSGSSKSKSKSSSDNSGLTIEKWTPVLLKKITPVSEHTSLFDFQLQKPCVFPVSSAVYVKDDEIQAMRAYTPIHSLEEEKEEGQGIGQDSFQLLIKRYGEGQVSRFVHSARPGQKIEMRGPILIWPGSRSDLAQWDEIGMIAGGTGITAMLPIIYSALTHPDKKIKVSLLFAAQVPEELYFKDQLDQLQKTYSNQLSVVYTVDKIPSSPTPTTTAEEWKGYVGYVNQDMLKGLMPTPNKTLDAPAPASSSPPENQTDIGNGNSNGNTTGKSIVLICGPESMVKHVAGSRGINGQEPVRGILGAMGYQKDQVFRFPN